MRVSSFIILLPAESLIPFIIEIQKSGVSKPGTPQRAQAAWAFPTYMQYYPYLYYIYVVFVESLPAPLLAFKLLYYSALDQPLPRLSKLAQMLLIPFMHGKQGLHAMEE
jgi:hypothetical protein